MSRLIDAMELKAAISVSAMLEDRKHIFDIIDEQPTIEPERKCGKWERWTDRVEHSRGVEYIPRCRCSECETEYDPHTASFMNFCPNCGARMESEE